jgi:ribosomal protein L37AE/L43A
MASYAYGVKPGTFASIREEAKESWRGITAFLNERPYLVIGKDGDKFVLEGEDGDIHTLESFQWTQATEGSRLVSASRHPDAALTRGSIFGQFTVGKLAYEDGEWFIRNGESDEVLPLDWMAERLETLDNDPLKLAWDIRLKAAERFGLRYDADYKCPMCKSHEVRFGTEDDAHCENCDHVGDVNEFLDEPPDYDGDRGMWYPDWTGPEASVKQAGTFEMPMPPEGLHFRTHHALGEAGLQGTVQYPPIPDSEEFAQGLMGQFPGNTALDEMDYTTEVEDRGMNPNDIMLQVTVPDGQEEQARQIIESWGGRGAVHGKIALEQNDQSGIGESDIESENKAVKCPRCGSHTLRSFGVQNGKAQLKCLTCGNDFTRPAMKNPEAKTASDDTHKFVPGQRVQLTHPNYKGERGSIVDYSGKHADLGEEQYEIQLDSGDKITNIPESAFQKIKSARVDNSDLPDTASNHFLDSMVFVADYPSGGGKMETLPLTEWDDNDTADDYDPKPSDNPHKEMEPEEQLCPMCHKGKGTSIGSLGAREYFRCNNCGMDWSLPDSGDAEQWGKPGEDPDNLFGQDGPEYQQFSHTARTDTAGKPLEAGKVYLMSGKNYTVPDLVRILNLEDNRIEAAIASDAKGAFPIVIESSDEADYKFEPVRHTKEDVKEASGWKLSKRNWSTKEQRDLIDENPDGRARNFDKLDLSGTHYETKSASDDLDFLWG